MALKSLNFTSMVMNIDSQELDKFSDELDKKRMMAPDFFSDAPIVVKVEDELLDLDFSKIKKIVHEHGFILLGISGELSATHKEQIKAQQIAILKSSKSAERRAKAVDESNCEAQAEEAVIVAPVVKTQIHTGRVRSGQQIYAKEGNLVINGDVGAGAEVIADGSIHIYGALRGKALAGAMGEKSASIFCQQLSPELVSIAGVYKISDDLGVDFIGKSGIVSLQEEQIVLSKLSRI